MKGSRLSKLRIKHAEHPTLSNPHPFKGLTACKRMVWFGGFVWVTDNTGPLEKITCKQCIKELQKRDNQLFISIVNFKQS